MTNIAESHTFKGEQTADVTNMDAQELKQFLKKWENTYKAGLADVLLFSPGVGSTLSNQQKQHFAKAFYHIRGHFHNFLWYMGNHAPNQAAREIILSNIAEEFGGDRCSHEQLYYRFSHELGVDIEQEVISEAAYADYIAQFNRGHLKWLIQHDWPSNLGAFSAYERLDNVDYPMLSSFVEELGLSGENKRFFTVHEKVAHFDALSQLLADCWSDTPEKVREGFNFIAAHQLEMWNNLSRDVLIKSHLN